MRRFQQTPAPLPLRRPPHQTQAHCAETLQAAGEREQLRPPARGGPTVAAGWAGLRQRQLQAQLGGQPRQGPARRGRAQAPLRIAPLVLLAQPAPQGRARQLPPLQLPSQPVHRLQLQHAQAHPH